MGINTRLSWVMRQLRSLKTLDGAQQGSRMALKEKQEAELVPCKAKLDAGQRQAGEPGLLGQGFLNLLWLTLH
jgi:hypothetical protein